VAAPLEALRRVLGERYALEEEIGRGGMAVVYRARDLRYDRAVAVKALRPDIAALLGAERFLREIRTAARLQHPHILPVYDSGGTDTLLYYVMPLVEGESLRARLRREQRLPLPDVLRLAQEVGKALAYAHRNNLVHRDIKPENVLLYDGHAMVVDFGIAKAIQESGDPHLTQTGMGIGTPAYMSPEQAFSEGTVDGRSDQYSLACVLFELLAGELPFTGNTAVAIMARKTTQEAPTLQGRPTAVPGGVEQAILRALSREPGDRFDSVETFLAALLGDGGQLPTHFPTAAAAGGDTGWSLVVLPFTNLSADPENEYLSDGLSEELIHALAQVPGLRVVARTSAFAFKGKQQDVRAIGAQLRVRGALEGSVRRVGRRLRVTTQLIDTSSGFELWSARFDRELDDLFEVQDEISRAIVDTLRLTLFGNDTRLVRPPTADLAAYEAYLKGRFQWNQRSEAALLECLRSFAQAVEIDPGFTLAHAALAEAYVTLAIYGVRAPTEAMPAARSAAERALGASRASGEALAARGSVRALYDWDWGGSESDFLAAIDASPQYPTAPQWLAMHCLAPRARLDEAGEHLRRAHELDPLSPAIELSLGVLHSFRGDPERAAGVYRRVLERYPGFGPAHYFLGLSLSELKRHDEAIRSLTLARTLTGDSSEVESALGLAHGRAGDFDAARSSLERLTARSGARYVSPVLLAQVHLGLGDLAAAVSALEQGLAARAVEMVLLNVRPAFRELRAMPRFNLLVETVFHGAEAGPT
jgi:eukaryotic-like serine/threonine-protein kinase